MAQAGRFSFFGRMSLRSFHSRQLGTPQVFYAYHLFLAPSLHGICNFVPHLTSWFLKGSFVPKALHPIVANDAYFGRKLIAIYQVKSSDDSMIAI
jgi:hypothetical protein